MPLVGESLAPWLAASCLLGLVTVSLFLGGERLPMFEKTMDGFSSIFHRISYEKIGASTIQSRAIAGLIGTTFVFVLPGSPGACKDAWDDILVHQLDYRYRPCNFVEIMPRLDEHLRRAKAKGATV